MERKTKQREAVLQVLLTENRPLSPPEILDVAQALVPRLGIATVYRAIKEFLESGDVVSVDLPGEGQRFEIMGKRHHHHFLCRLCRKLYEVNGCPGTLDALPPPEGFLVEIHEILLKGICVSCA